MNKISIKEILEQPVLINNLIKNEAEHVIEICSKLKGKFDYILIAARGTSDNAARYAQYLLGSYNQIQVALATPSLFTTYQTPPSLKGALVMGISQSGQSPDIVSVLESAQKQGCPTICITNDTSSPLANVSDHIIPLRSGAEKAVAATKTYTSTLTALSLLSCYLSGDNKSRLNDLYILPERISKVLENTFENIGQTSRYRYMNHCAVIGRGFNYSTAFEISLKIKELTRVIATPYSSADFKHGPIAMVNKGFPIFVVAPSGKMYEHILGFAEKLIDLEAELIVISDRKKILNLGKASFVLPSGTPEWLSPITSIIPGQLFARQLAIEKGLDSDNPEGLSKVTQTF
ncbi:MAG: SIS domain-containing protein [Pelolinea sp.]|nr:SIS domain-containing protein [Pelolinea sp.]